MIPSIRHYPPGAGRQSGAVLYVALIMLVLLALIGVVGMQVAGLQERMSSNFRAANMAFQATESVVRNAECVIEDINNRTTTAGCNIVAEADIRTRCDDGFDPGQWVRDQGMSGTPAVHVRRIDSCIAAEGPIAMGGPIGANPFPVYQITAFSADDSDAPSSTSGIDAVFKL
jgi:type IV pilus assembly protein PilX